MVRHIVTWNYKEGFSPEENRENARKVKTALEGLARHIPEIVSLSVHIDALPSSNRDVVLTSLFESVETLAAYQVHPEHHKISAFVGSVLRNRACIDYYE